MTTDWRVVSCTGKVSFATWGEANDVRKARNRTGKSGKRQVYRCSFCGAFHLGTPGRPRLARRK